MLIINSSCYRLLGRVKILTLSHWFLLLFFQCLLHAICMPMMHNLYDFSSGFNLYIFTFNKHKNNYLIRQFLVKLIFLIYSVSTLYNNYWLYGHIVFKTRQQFVGRKKVAHHWLDTNCYSSIHIYTRTIEFLFIACIN